MTLEERWYAAKIYANKHNQNAKDNIEDIPFIELKGNENKGLSVIRDKSGSKSGSVKDKDLDKTPKALVRSKRLNVVGGAVAGGAIGAGVGVFSSRKLTDKINALNNKSNKTPKDLQELKRLRSKKLRRIALGTGAGVVVGGAGAHAYNKLKK